MSDDFFFNHNARSPTKSRSAIHGRSHYLPHRHRCRCSGDVRERPVAFITAILSASSGPLMQPQNVVRIGSVCVAEPFWGKGIGRALIQRVKDWAIEQDAQDLRLTVWPFNERAVRMYAEFGFETRALEMGVRL
ncbi:GNAT family N-acetyltransferase [Pseudomonas neuropathica]